MPSPGKIRSYFTNRIRVHVHVQRTRRATCTTYVLYLRMYNYSILSYESRAMILSKVLSKYLISTTYSTFVVVLSYFRKYFRTFLRRYSINKLLLTTRTVHVHVQYTYNKCVRKYFREVLSYFVQRTEVRVQYVYSCTRVQLYLLRGNLFANKNRANNIFNL